MYKFSACGSIYDLCHNIDQKDMHPMVTTQSIKQALGEQAMRM